jgi:Fe-S cluster assembly iron-binding protein IscA
MMLTLKEVDGAYTRENLASVVYNVTVDWGIAGNLGYFVIDNANVNNRMLKDLSFCKLLPYFGLIT